MLLYIYLRARMFLICILLLLPNVCYCLPFIVSLSRAHARALSLVLYAYS